MPGRQNPGHTPLRRRDLAEHRFNYWKNKIRDPAFLKVARNTGLVGFEPDVENVAKECGLDPKSALDRELLLRVLAHVHSSRPGNALTDLAGITLKVRRRGRPQKWDMGELCDDIAAVFSQQELQTDLSNQDIAERLKKEKKSKYGYMIIPTLIKRLQEFRRMAPALAHRGRPKTKRP